MSYNNEPFHLSPISASFVPHYNLIIISSVYVYSQYLLDWFRYFKLSTGFPPALFSNLHISCVEVEQNPNQTKSCKKLTISLNT